MLDFLIPWDTTEEVGIYGQHLLGLSLSVDLANDELSKGQFELVPGVSRLSPRLL